MALNVNIDVKHQMDLEKIGRSMIDFFSRLKLGITRNWQKSLLSIFAAYGCCWAIIEPINALVKKEGAHDDLIQGPGKFGIMVGIAVIAGFLRLIPKTKVSFPLGLTGGTVEVRFGDLFEDAGQKVIPVNDAFDSDLETPTRPKGIVAPKSLHGLFIAKKCNGIPAVFDTLVAEALTSTRSFPFVRTDGGKPIRYPLGTTVGVLGAGRDQFYLFALTRTNPDTSVPETTLPEHLEALDGLWEKVRVTANGSDIAVPLFGNGLAAISLPPQQLLHLLLTSYLSRSSPKRITTCLRVVLHRSVFEHVDLSELRRNWGG